MALFCLAKCDGKWFMGGLGVVGLAGFNLHAGVSWTPRIVLQLIRVDRTSSVWTAATAGIDSWLFMITNCLVSATTND